MCEAAGCGRLSSAAIGFPLLLLLCIDGRSEVDGDRAYPGRTLEELLALLERLLDDEALRRVGEVGVPIAARLARAVDVRSRARAASERRLRFWERLVEVE